MTDASGTIRHLTVTTVMRPPRAVILFRGDANWRYWARLAMRAAQRTWSGGGHLLVPYSAAGEISEQLLPVIGAFDPDHVLLFDATIGEWEVVNPGAFKFTSEGKLLEGPEREEFLQRWGKNQHADDVAGRRALHQLETLATPFTSLIEEDGTKHQVHSAISADGSSGLALVPDAILEASHLAVPASWSSDAALLAASVMGIADGSEVEAPPDHELLSAAFPFNRVAQERDPLAALWTGEPTEPVKTRINLLDFSVADYMGVSVHRGGALVIGDGPEDFSLAMAYRLMLGMGLWVSPSMLADEDTRLRGVGQIVHERVRALGRRGDRLSCISASMDEDELRPVLEDVSAAAFRWIPPDDDEALSVTAGPLLPKLVQRKLVTEGLGDHRSVPVEVRADGSVCMLNSFAPPVPQPPRLNDDAYWYVDVRFEGLAMPTGRSLPDSALTSSERWDLVRSSSAGVTVMTASQGFVASGAVMAAKLAHPRLVCLSVRAWVEQMARAAGLDARLSQAGRAAELAARRLGSRKALIDLVAGPFAHLLKPYADRLGPRRQRELRRASAPGAVVLGTQPYLSFTEMQLELKADGTADSTWLRATLDTLLDRDLARMGLILGCNHCGRPSFYEVDDLRQRFRCPLCGAANALSATTWRDPPDEPTWYYDLHTAFRQLATQRGDLPLRLAARLAAEDPRSYGDCSELEFTEAGSAVAETDLIAHVDGMVVVAETKATPELGESAAKRRKQAAKLARVARTVRADRIILGTEKAEWPHADLDRVSKAIESEYGWLPKPSVEYLGEL